MQINRQRLQSLVALCCGLLLSLSATAQDREVNAEEIMEALRAGNDISYENVTIVGVLDFTYSYEKADDLPNKRWWNWKDSNTIEEDVEQKVSFVNCTFLDDVLAYYHDDRTEYTFTANFEDEVVFKNCDFRRNAMFKYSEFERVVDFSGTTFDRESNFKYAEFEEFANFSACDFDEEGNFKYAEFDRGLDLTGTLFQEDLNIKYSEVRGDFLIDELAVDGEINAKYTKINGRSFASHSIRRHRDDD